jgi:hypothetical protein
MESCPKCTSRKVHRSRPRTHWETWRKNVTAKRIFRCHSCGWRGWGALVRPTLAEIESELVRFALADEPPNLNRTALARGESRPEIDLDALDAFPVDHGKGE